jgi:hypothetical protein
MPIGSGLPSSTSTTDTIEHAAFEKETKGDDDNANDAKDNIDNANDIQDNIENDNNKTGPPSNTSVLYHSFINKGINNISILLSIYSIM